MSKKHTIEFVKSQFKKEGYTLLSRNYIGAHSKLDYICPEGHKHFMNWNKWQQGRRCVYCANDKISKIKRLDFNIVKCSFKKENYILLTKKYKNAHQKLKYICPKGHYHSIKWNSWQQGNRCPYCAGNGKLTIDFVQKEFEKENYVLLSKNYKNSQQKLDYICSSGHRHTTSWDNWRGGARCPTCFFIKNSGFNHPMWKGGISCEPYCDVWLDKDFKRSIKDRDGNKCLNPDCWKTAKRLTIHHVDYDKKNCEPYNLITLCTSCNSRANKDREWHEDWYKAIIYRRYEIQWQ
jgi:hypothetical protein